MVTSQPILRYISRTMPIIVTAVFLSACGTQHLSNTTNHDHLQTERLAAKRSSLLQASQDEFESMVHNLDIKSKLLEQYATWKGVHYRLGGNSKRGIDCSAFVQRTFSEQFGLTLPRSTSQQRTAGQQIQRSNLRIGDLVLFRAGPTGGHIGIYLGNDQFVHVSTSSGVTISNMNTSYWKKRYREARRVLDNADTNT